MGVYHTKGSTSNDISINILTKLPTDLKYNCLFFLDKESYYSMTKVLKIPLNIKTYYKHCENELLNNDWRRYYKLCKSFNIPLKLHKHHQINKLLINNICNEK